MGAWTRRARVLAPLLAALVLTLTPALSDASPSIELVSPSDRSKLRAPELVEVAIAIPPGEVIGLVVEIDGLPHTHLLPWRSSVEVELEPGLYQVSVRGRELETGATLRSGTVRVAVFPEETVRTTRRGRNTWTAAVAFALAVLGATLLRRRGW